MPEMRTSALPILAIAVLPMTYSCREYKSSSRPSAPAPAAVSSSSPAAAVAPLLLARFPAASPTPSPSPARKEPSALLLQPPRSARHGRANPEDSPPPAAAAAAASCRVDVGRTTCPARGGCVCRLAAPFRPWAINPAEASAEPTWRATSNSRTSVLRGRFMSLCCCETRQGPRRCGD